MYRSPTEREFDKEGRRYQGVWEYRSVDNTAEYGSLDNSLWEYDGL
jgi:hypothetical protein